MEQDPIPGSTMSISLLFSVCTQLYKDLLLALEIRTPSSSDVGNLSRTEVLDEWSRLKIWAEETGATRSQHERGSLDDALRTTPDLAASVLGIMQLLRNCLENVLALSQPKSNLDAVSDTVGTSSESDTESDDSGLSSDSGISSHHPEKTRIQKSFLRVHDCIQSLYRLSVLIKRPTTADKFIRSEGKERSDLNAFIYTDQDHVFEKLEQWNNNRKHIVDIELEEATTQEDLYYRASDRSNSLDPKIVLGRRLGKCNTRRREQLWHWRDHPYRTAPRSASCELSSQPTIKLSALQPLPLTMNVSTTKSVQSESRTMARSTNQDSSATRQSFSTVAASAINDKITVSGRPRTVYEPTVVGASQDIRVPDVPPQALSGGTFECPYCSSTLDSTTMRDRNNWKQHVFRDLRPYVCTFSSCQNPEKLYVTKRDWIHHEMQLHRRRWVCPGSKCALELYEKDSMTAHLRNCHSDLFAERQMPVLLEICERQIDAAEIVQCPLCPEAHPLPGLQSHLAAHLEKLALFVLPMPVFDAEGSISNQAAASRTMAHSRDAASGSIGTFAVSDTNDTQGPAQALTDLASATIQFEEEIPASYSLMEPKPFSTFQHRLANLRASIVSMASNIVQAWEYDVEIEKVFVELSFLVASCILLDSIRFQTTFFSVKKIYWLYVKACDDALDEFCEDHRPCGYRSNELERCVVTQANHKGEGHRARNGQYLGSGQYQVSFTKESFRERWRSLIYYRLKVLEYKKDFGEGVSFRRNLCKDNYDNIRQGLVFVFHEKGILEPFFAHASNGEEIAAKPACCSCLMGERQHHLPCGHFVCPLCARNQRIRDGLFQEGVTRTFRVKCPLGHLWDGDIGENPEIADVDCGPYEKPMMTINEDIEDWIPSMEDPLLPLWGKNVITKYSSNQWGMGGVPRVYRTLPTTAELDGSASQPAPSHHTTPAQSSDEDSARPSNSLRRRAARFLVRKRK